MKIHMQETKQLTFEEGCNRYLQNCKERNLRDATIRHYQQSYQQFYKFFNREMPLAQFDESSYKRFVLHLRETMNNDVSINTYLRDLITTMHFLMDEGYLAPFKMKSIRVDKNNVETYTDNELQLLLRKPNIKTCTFNEYQCWVMTNFLFCTGVRQRSLMYIQVKDLDFDNYVVYVNVTKNRKPLIVPINQSLTNILIEYLKHRQHRSDDDFLFCNVYGQQLVKSTCYHMLYSYNKSRGVETTGIHRYRHTFAKQWILNGGNVVTLSQILGHSSLNITQNYVHLLVSDVAKQVNEINLLEKFSSRQAIKLK